VVHGDHPGHPATARLGATLHRLTERCLVRSRMVECCHDLEVDPAVQREHEVTGAETWMQAAVRKGCPECATQPLCGCRESFWAGGIREVVKAHRGHS